MKNHCFQEADTEVVAIARGDVGVGAGDAHGGDAGLVEYVARSDGYAGAVRADNSNNAAAHEILRGGDGRGLVGLVIDLNELDLIFLAVDRHTGDDLVGIARAEHFLHAAGAVLTRGGLKNADLQYVAFHGGDSLLPQPTSRAQIMHAQRMIAKIFFMVFLPLRNTHSPYITDKCVSISNMTVV